MRAVERVMGTAVEIEATGVDRSVVAAAFERLRWVEETFSVFRPDSEIRRIGDGRLDRGDAHRLVRSVLDTCDELEEKTSGWFRARSDARPLDPSGYVKGWAVDLVVDDLVAAGVQSASVWAGGDVATLGSAADGEPWPVAIRSPLGGVLDLTIGLTDAAVATSGAYERGDHVWGDGAGTFTSVTVVGPSLGMADALATALLADGGADLSWMDRFDLYDTVVLRADGMVAMSPGIERRRLPAHGQGRIGNVDVWNGGSAGLP